MKPRPVHACDCGAHVWLCLTKGYVALVSPEDRDKVEGKNWNAKIGKSNGHIQVYARRKSASRHRELMHRVIAGDPDGPQIDHINHNGVDNQRGNLRPTTGTQNQYNCRKRARTSSRFKGVSFYRRHGLWLAKIYVKGRAKHLGYFPTEEAAYRAYEVARREIVHFQPALAA